MIGLHLSVERIDDELCELLARTRVRALVGLQTFGDAALIEANRRWFKPDRFEKGIERLLRHGVNIYNIQIIYGLPDDSYEQFCRNVSWTLDRSLRMWCGPLLLLPGTAFAKRASELEIVADPEPPYQIISSRGYSAQDMKRSSHLATGIDFYNRLGPGAIKEGADLINLSDIDFMAKIGEWWIERCERSGVKTAPANLPGLFTFVTEHLAETGSSQDPKPAVQRILQRAQKERHR